MKNCVTILAIFLSLIVHSYSQNDQAGLRWAQQLDYGYSQVEDMVVDNQGNVYVAGYTSFGFSKPESRNMLIGKFSADGKLVWKDTVQWVPNQQDIAYDIALDNNGDIYVAGGSAGTLPILGSVTLIKYNPVGARLWQKQLTSPGEYGVSSGYAAVATDNAGNVYLNYNTENPIIATTTIKYNSSGTLQWQKTFGAGTKDEGSAARVMVTDGDGNVYIAGYDYSKQRTITLKFLTLKYNSEGEVQWSDTEFDYVTDGNSARSITVDGAGNVFFLGQYNESGALSLVAVIKYSSSGTRQWAKTKTGEVRGLGDGYIKADSDGNVYILATTVGFTPSNPDFLLTKYDPAGNEVWSKTYGGVLNKDDIAFGGLAIDNQNNIYITGQGQISAEFGYDILTLKYDPQGNLIWAKNYFNDIIGQNIVVTPAGDIYVGADSRGGSQSASSIHVVKYFQSAASVQKPVSAPGTYTFNASGNNTAITITFNTVTGTGTVNVSYFGFPAVNTTFSTATPINISQYKWVIEALGITGIDAELKIAIDKLQNSGGIIDPNDVKIFKREIEGRGAFTELATKFENGELKASITGFSEFILGSNSSPLLVEEEGGTTPKSFSLLQNFPEPFKSSTKIRFALPNSSFVNLTVYDNFGKEIAVVVNEELGEGNYYYQFNGDNLPSGVYFYKLTTDNFTETKKMMLAK